MNQAKPLVAAVCIPPGARLKVSDIPAPLQKEFGISEEEIVVFDQLTADPFAYRDCVKFSNGRRTLLQTLRPGQRIEVLSLVSTESENIRPVLDFENAGVRD
jgi:hypothetical protein